MDLVLWRHAEAADAAPGQDDLERALTTQGERQALRVGAWLDRQLPGSARVLASPARRTQQTASALDRRFRTVPSLAPGSGVDALLEAARWPDARQPTLVVGHQPTLGLAAAFLVTGHAQPWPLRKGGVVWLRARLRDGRLQVVLHAVTGPELI